MQPEESGAHRRFMAGAVAIVLLALALRFYGIGRHEVWLDEAFSWHVATMSRWFASILIDNTPPLLYLLLRAWLRFAGTSEAALRVLSALAGTVFVALVIWVGHDVFNRASALWGGLVAALAPIGVYYSQEARAYTLLDALLLATSILCWRAVKTNSWHHWGLLTLSATMVFYTHYLAALALVPVAVLIFLLPEPQRLARGLVSLAVSFLLFVPWIVGSFILASRPNVGTSWIENVWVSTPPVMAIPRSLEMFVLGGQAGLIPLWMRQFSAIEFSPELRLIGIAAAIVLAIAVAVPRGDEELEIPWLHKRKLWFVGMLFFPLIVLWLISWIKPLYAVGRFDMVAYPATPVLAGLGLAKLQRVKGPIVAAVVAFSLLFPNAVKLGLYFGVTLPTEDRPVAQMLAADVRNEDVVVFTGLRGLPVLYYLSRLGFHWEGGFCVDERAGRRFYCRMYPRETESTPAGTSTSQLLGSPELARREAEHFLARLGPRSGILWLVEWGASPEGKLKVPRADKLLISELERMGMRRVSVSSRSRFATVVQFRMP